MNQFCALDIQDSYAIALDIDKKNDVYSILESQTIDIEDLPNYLKNKKNLFVNIEQEEDIDEKISLASIIKNVAAIRGSISLRLAENTSNRKSIFNYSEIAQESSENKTYQVDGVYEQEYLEKLSLIEDLAKIQSATISKFALFGISRECIKEESYFSIYTSSNKITTIAVHKNEIIYSRTNRIVARNAELRILNLVGEINQTINYVKGQFRDIKFSTIAFSGAIVIDDTIAEHLYLSLQDVNITVLYPNTFIKGIEDGDVQSYIIALGTIFVPKRFQFLPTSVLEIKQYKLISKALFITSFLPILFLSLFSINQYISYIDTFEKYEILKKKLSAIAEKTETYSEAELQKSLNYLQIVEQHLKYHPVDLLTMLEPLLKLQKTDNLNWKYQQNSFELKVSFKRSFDTLESLYEFEKKFYNTFNDLNTTLNRNYKKETNYATLDFASTITITDKQNEPAQKAPAKRRR